MFNGQNLRCIRSERLVFQGLDFSLAEGAALVLVGPNGSGKSSLLRMMAGLLPAAGGVLSWEEEPVYEDLQTHGGRLHYVGHADAVKPVLSVAENLAFWTELRRTKGMKEGVAQALKAFAISHLADIPGRFLSAGQKRRLGLARLLSAPADLWLLDEPTTALDDSAVACLEKAIEEHRDRGGMVVVSTHTKMAITSANVLNLNDFSQDQGAMFAMEGE
jgi:heme exporter protein A